MCERCDELEEELTFLKSLYSGTIEEADRARLTFGTTPKESELLVTLYRKKGELVTKEHVYRVLWPNEADESENPDEVARTFISKLRFKLFKTAIVGVWGRGWALSPEGLAHVRAALGPKKEEESLNPSSVP